MSYQAAQRFLRTDGKHRGYEGAEQVLPVKFPHLPIRLARFVIEGHDRFYHPRT
jgi:hypothetical protein